MCIVHNFKQHLEIESQSSWTLWKLQDSNEKVNAKTSEKSELIETDYSMLHL